MLAGKRRFHPHQTDKSIIKPSKNSDCVKQENERTKPISRKPKDRMLVQRNFALNFKVGDVKPLSILRFLSPQTGGLSTLLEERGTR